MGRYARVRRSGYKAIPPGAPALAWLPADPTAAATPREQVVRQCAPPPPADPWGGRHRIVGAVPTPSQPLGEGLRHCKSDGGGGSTHIVLRTFLWKVQL